MNGRAAAAHFILIFSHKRAKGSLNHTIHMLCIDINAKSMQRAWKSFLSIYQSIIKLLRSDYCNCDGDCGCRWGDFICVCRKYLGGEGRWEKWAEEVGRRCITIGNWTKKSDKMLFIFFVFIYLLEVDWICLKLKFLQSQI